MKRYGNVGLVYTMKPRKLIKLLAKAKKKDGEERAWQYWLTLDGEVKKELPFSKFLAEVNKPITQQENTNEEQIMQDAENILNMFKRSE